MHYRCRIWSEGATVWTLFVGPLKHFSMPESYLSGPTNSVQTVERSGDLADMDWGDRGCLKPPVLHSKAGLCELVREFRGHP